MPKGAADTHAVGYITQLKRRISGLNLAQAFEREVVLILSVGLSLYHWTAIGSYSPLDPSFNTFVYPETTPFNLAGAYGAHLASLTVYCCGLIAWLLPLPLLTSAITIFRKRSDALAPTRMTGWILALSCACVGVAWVYPSIQMKGLDLPSGGFVGIMLGNALRKTLGLTGGTIALCTLGGVACLWLTRRPLLAPLLDLIHVPKVSIAWPKLPTAAWLRKRAPNSPQETPSADTNTTPSNGPTVGLPTIEPHKDNNIPTVQKTVSSDLFDRPFAPPQPFQVQKVSQEAPEFFVKNTKYQSDAVSYTPPPLTVFNRSDTRPQTVAQHEFESTSALLVKTFEDFGVMGKIIGYQPGPVVTVYEFQPDAGVKQSKILGLIDDLALALKADSIFIHPVRGKRALGVQVPNSKREPVHLGDILGTTTFRDAPSPLTFGLGKTITGHPMCVDLTSMPHLLVAGATGSGKSVGINAMLCSIIMKATPEQVRMILVDPKMLELSVYEGIPHLLMPVITEPSKASLALKWAASEMERRYRLMQLACVRNIEGFNEFWSRSSDDRRSQLKDAMDDGTLDRLPYILLVIDELADLMMTAPKDVEAQIQRLAQKARASGIHMVLATQRPSVDIITGVIKANLPCRMAYQVVSKHDSRTILDLVGAEKLLGKGDLLFQRPGVGRLERLQGALITDEEVLNLVASVKASSSVRYDEKIIHWIDDEFARQKDGEDQDDAGSGSLDDEPKFQEAIALARAQGVVSASFLQRHLKIGYNRAARMVEFMESKGLVDKADGAKPRKWLGH